MRSNIASGARARRRAWFFAPSPEARDWTGPYRSLEDAIGDAMGAPPCRGGACFAPGRDGRQAIRVIWGGGPGEDRGGLRRFGDLPLGARFRVPGRDGVLVAIETLGRGLVAPWSGNGGPPGEAGRLFPFAADPAAASESFVEVVG